LRNGTGEIEANDEVAEADVSWMAVLDKLVRPKVEVLGGAFVGYEVELDGGVPKTKLGFELVVTVWDPPFWAVICPKGPSETEGVLDDVTAGSPLA